VHALLVSFKIITGTKALSFSFAPRKVTQEVLGVLDLVFSITMHQPGILKIGTGHVLEIRIAFRNVVAYSTLEWVATVTTPTTDPADL
jgi:hypothetical protein